MNFNKKPITIKNKNKFLSKIEILFLIALYVGLAILLLPKDETTRIHEEKPVSVVSQTYAEFKVNSNGQAQEVPKLEKEEWEERMDEILVSYDRKEDVQEKRWNRVGEKWGIKPPVLVCIAKADSSLGRQLKSKNNFGNVGNNDRGDVVHYPTAIAGIDAIGRVLNNKYLGHKQSIGSLSVGGGGNAPYYATSPENWNNNVINCLRAIYNDYSIDEDFMIRIK